MNKEQINKIISLGKKITDQKLDENQLNYIYNIGVKHFKVANYKQALQVLQLVTIYDSSNPLYMKALAACLQAMKQYMPAAACYKIAYALGEEDYLDCCYYAGVCLYESELWLKAEGEFRLYIEADNLDEGLVKKSKMYLEAIKNTLQAEQDKKTTASDEDKKTTASDEEVKDS